MIKDLAKLATRLDRLGLTKEADVLDSTLQKLAQSMEQQQADRAEAMKAGIFSGGEDPFAAISDSKLPAGISGAVGNLRAPSRTQIGSGGLAARSPGFGASPGVAEMGRGDYEGGAKGAKPLYTSPGKPGVATKGRARGLPSNPWRSFLHASPRSIAEFNDTLSQMFEIVPRTSKLVPADVRSNLPKGQVKWTDQTQKAFGVIANLAGYPEAGKPGGWSGPNGGKDGILGWAQKNNYEPTMNGILKFWDDNKQKVIDRLTQELYEFAAAAEAQATAGIEEQQKQEGDISTIGDSNQGPRVETLGGPAKLPPPEAPTAKDYKEQIDKYEEYQNVPKSNPDAMGGSGIDERILSGLRRRVYSQITGGTGIQLGVEGERFFSTLTGQVMRKIESAMRADPEVATWFAQDPKIVFPQSNVDRNDYNSIYSGPNQNIKGVYNFLQTNAKTIEDAKARAKARRSAYY